MNIQVNNKPHEAFNLIVAFEPGVKYDQAMLTVGRINHQTKEIRITAHYEGDEAVELYSKLTRSEVKE